MRKWANYADPHHRILLDALSNDPVFNKHEYKAALNVQAEMIVLRHRKDQYEWSRLILIVLNTKMQTKMQYVPRIATKQSCNLPVNMEKE